MGPDAREGWKPDSWGCIEEGAGHKIPRLLLDSSPVSPALRAAEN